ncbi:hypothetical protein [Paenibacillus lutimineralis]|uniref:Uncharacterized protein n=1 Tax=Paenibacillus lutimineralis TaxID=2707005 RepID=A0A3Q9IB92_9BACL|nr:hypothetical protein [Paenibacillus lutimineralis]AZS16809.1 hypothetical protein EI981_21660 [Paenibacillus lutimineralis]
MKKIISFSLGGVLLLCFVLFSSVTSSSVFASGDRGSFSPSLYQMGSSLEGGTSTFAGYKFVAGPISAYFELYRDGTYLGSKYGESDNYYLDRYAHALITSGVHTTSGSYKMTWSGRIGKYYSDGSDYTDAGEKTYYLSSSRDSKKQILEEEMTENKLVQSWEKGREIISLNNESFSEWTLMNTAQLHEKLSNLSRQERSSFLNAFYSEERTSNLDVGDYMSAILISPNNSEALVYWEKSDSRYVVIHLLNDDSNWYVDSTDIIN